MSFKLITILKDVYSKVADVTVDWEWYKCVEDRKGHDFRYAIDTFEFKNEFPQFKLTPYNQSIEETVKFYIS